MLILSRKVEESINIGDTITIKILGIQDGQIKIGIDAPKDIKIFRSEIYIQVQQENIQASKAQRASMSKVATMLKSKL